MEEGALVSPPILLGSPDQTDEARFGRLKEEEVQGQVHRSEWLANRIDGWAGRARVFRDQVSLRCEPTLVLCFLFKREGIL